MSEKLNEDYDNELTQKMMSQVEESQSISNKEALRDKIHEIHNYLRNHGAGYGMNALKVFNIIYGLKKIEENGLLDKVNLKRPECEFSHLLKLANAGDNVTLADLIIGEVLDSINDSVLKPILFYEIPKNIRGSTFAHLIQEINKITMIEKSCNVLLSGKIYEYFIGRDESAISELGAYFTDRHIVDYILGKLNPGLESDGGIGSMIDMFGGSGGFTTGYINYMKEKFPEIDWSTEINKVSHYDMNEDVIRSAGLEFFCLTGQLPNIENLKYKNSFNDEFGGRKYKYPLTNPPYGGDKSNKTDTQDKRTKIKDFIKKELVTCTDESVKLRRQKQLKSIEASEKQDKKDDEKSKVCLSTCSNRIGGFATKHKLKGNDKESCSLMLLMDIVDVGGTAIGVLKEGVFFNKTYKDLRRVLIENYNVREVISVPQDQFENTSTKTSIIIFDNSETKTQNVVFRELTVERYEEDKFSELFGEVVLAENKGDIRGVSDQVVSEATRDELLANDICSLNGKDYGKKEIVCGAGYELVKLGDIADLKNGKQLDKRNIIPGIYPVYAGGLIPIGYHNEYNGENSTLITETGRCGMVQFDVSKFWHSQCFTVKSNNSLINSYLFNICKSMEHTFSERAGGSVQQHIRASQFKDLLIPIPKSPEKIQYWVDRISKPYNEKNEKTARVKELETMIQERIKRVDDFDEVELGSVCEYINGKKRNTTDGKPNGIYPLFSSSLSVDNWIDEYDYNYDDGCIIINTINGSGHFNLQYSKRFCATSNTIIFKMETQNLLLYTYYFGLINIDIINNLSNGSTKKKWVKTIYPNLKSAFQITNNSFRTWNRCFKKSRHYKMKSNWRTNCIRNTFKN